MPAGDIEILPDVDFKHRAEDGENGPRYSWEKIDNSSFYMTSEKSDAFYRPGMPKPFQSTTIGVAARSVVILLREMLKPEASRKGTGHSALR